MMRHFVCFVLSGMSMFFVGNNLSAQTDSLVVQYVDSSWKVCSRDSAMAFHEISFNRLNPKQAKRSTFGMDSVLWYYQEFGDYAKKENSGVYRSYYRKSGQIERECFYLEDEKEGIERVYHDNGKLRFEINYSAGKKDGTLKLYNSNGNLIRTEVFNDGIPVSGKCYSDSGERIDCLPFDREAKFPGGDAQFVNYVMKNYKYPPSLRKKRVEGEVRVQFVVDTAGMVTKAEVIESTDPLFAEEALRVVLASPKWIPAYYEGRPVRAWRVIPIKLSVE